MFLHNISFIVTWVPYCIMYHTAYNIQQFFDPKPLFHGHCLFGTVSEGPGFGPVLYVRLGMGICAVQAYVDALAWAHQHPLTLAMSVWNCRGSRPLAPPSRNEERMLGGSKSFLRFLFSSVKTRRGLKYSLFTLHTCKLKSQWNRSRDRSFLLYWCTSTFKGLSKKRNQCRVEIWFDALVIDWILRCGSCIQKWR